MRLPAAVGGVQLQPKTVSGVQTDAAVSAAADAAADWSAAEWAGPAAARDQELLGWLQEQYEAATTHTDHFSCKGPVFDRVRPQPASTVCFTKHLNWKDSSLHQTARPYPPICRTARWPTGATGPTSSVSTSRPCPNCSSALTRMTRWGAVVSFFRRTWDAAWRRDARVLPSSCLPSFHDRRQPPADFGSVADDVRRNCP